MGYRHAHGNAHLCNQAEIILLAETMADCGHKMAVMKKVVNMQ